MELDCILTLSIGSWNMQGGHWCYEERSCSHGTTESLSCCTQLDFVEYVARAYCCIVRDVCSSRASSFLWWWNLKGVLWLLVHLRSRHSSALDWTSTVVCRYVQCNAFSCSLFFLENEQNMALVSGPREFKLVCWQLLLVEFPCVKQVKSFFTVIRICWVSIREGHRFSLL
jgi:hypothetical protein